jgi:hypothetical protein
VLWQMLKEGRARAADGFEGYDGKVKQVEALQDEVATLKAEIAALKAGTAPALPHVPTVVERVPRAGANVVPLSRSNPPAAPAAPAAYDYNANQDWKNWIEPDGSIRTTPRGPGRYWGPV